MIGAPDAQSTGPQVYSSKRQSDGTWSAVRPLPDVTPFGQPTGFGHSLAVDGAQALVGAYGGAAEASQGHLFTDNGDGTWAYRQLIEPDLEDSQQFQDFAWSVDLSGGTLVLGAPGDNGADEESFGYRGAAFVASESPAICYDTGSCLCVDGYSGATCDVAP